MAATIPGVQVMASTYHDTMVLYTATDEVRAVVDGARPGANGRLFIVPPGKPTKVPFEAGRFILEHLGYTGVVRVEEQETETGVTWDVDKAKEESLAKSEEQDTKRLSQFVSDMVTDFVQRNKPVPAPPESIMRIIERRKFDLKKYGIRPIGFADPAQEQADGLAAENKNLKDQLAILSAQVAQLMKQNGGEDTEADGEVPTQPARARRK
jgi:hypothetical protein